MKTICLFLLKLLISLIVGFSCFFFIYGAYYSGFRISYKYIKVRSQIFNSIKPAFRQFETTYGVMPSSDNWHNELLGNDKAIINKHKIHFVLNDTKDAWGNEFRAIIPGIHNTVDVYSLGENGISKTNGNDPDDMNTWSRLHEGQYYQRKIMMGKVYEFIIGGLICSLIAFTFIYGLISRKKQNPTRSHQSDSEQSCDFSKIK